LVYLVHFDTTFLCAVSFLSDRIPDFTAVEVGSGYEFSTAWMAKAIGGSRLYTFEVKRRG